MNDDVCENLLDARSCLEQGLHRAAIVLVGLAFEEVIEICFEEARHRPLPLGPAPAHGRITALHRQEMLKPAVGTGGLNLRGDRLAEVEAAFVAAENARSWRNKASHPKKHKFDEELVEHLLVLAGMNIPTLWKALGIAPGWALP